MFLFIVYAVFVWYLALRFRRTWAGFAYVTLGMAGVGVVGWGHFELNKLVNIYLPVLQSILYPYGALVGMVGYFVAALPLKHGGSRCRTCGYELRGLETDQRTCPECGTLHILKHSPGDPCTRCETALPRHELHDAICPVCCAVHLAPREARKFIGEDAPPPAIAAPADAPPASPEERSRRLRDALADLHRASQR